MAHGKNVALTKKRYHRKYREIQNAYKNSNNAQYKNHSHSAHKIKNTTPKTTTTKLNSTLESPNPFTLMTAHFFA